MSGPARCNWHLGDELYLDYHDREFDDFDYMQATGMVNDHTTDCFRYGEIKALIG